MPGADAGIVVGMRTSLSFSACLGKPTFSLIGTWLAPTHDATGHL